MSNATDITGDKGENLTTLIVSEIALVEKQGKDTGLDFHCRWRGKYHLKIVK